MDSSINFFLHHIDEARLCDVVPIILVLTWRSQRVGTEGISKRLGIFLVFEKIMEVLDAIRSWVGNGALSIHCLIFHLAEKDEYKPPKPFKFNSI